MSTCCHSGASKPRCCCQKGGLRCCIGCKSTKVWLTIRIKIGKTETLIPLALCFIYAWVVEVKRFLNFYVFKLYHKAAPKLEWFQNAESMLNHHLSGLLGLGCLSWAGHQIHISLPINKLLDAGLDPKEIPLPREVLINRDLMAQLYPSFAKGLSPFFTLNWSEYFA